MSHNKLTAKQSAYLAARIAGAGQRDAAVAAGYSENSASEAAARLERHPTIKREIETAHASVVTDAKVTLQGCFEKLHAAFNVAQARNNAGAMVMAVTALAKLAGLWVEKTEDLTARDEAQRKASSYEFKSAGALLAEAAESLGLDRAATPAMIVGALAERPIAAPEAFRLLYAAQADTSQETAQ